MRITYNPNLRPSARKLRKYGTLAEVLLWEQLKGRKIKGYPFTRQKPIGNYVVDFYCSRLRVAIEVDGVTHDERLQQDKVRQKEVEKQGVTVLRFYDSDFKTNLNGILLTIVDWIDKKEKQGGYAHRTGCDRRARRTPPCGPPSIGGTWSVPTHSRALSNSERSSASSQESLSYPHDVE